MIKLGLKIEWTQFFLMMWHNVTIGFIDSSPRKNQLQHAFDMQGNHCWTKIAKDPKFFC